VLHDDGWRLAFQDLDGISSDAGEMQGGLQDLVGSDAPWTRIDGFATAGRIYTTMSKTETKEEQT
jgi:hypothetical protein